MKKKMKFNTKAIHGGQILDPAYNSVMTPIYQTSTYAQSSPGKHKGYEYSPVSYTHLTLPTICSV